MSPYPEAYKEYLLFFHAQRDYFECHEIMEEFWKEHPGDVRGQTYVALIQIAVGLYHDRRGNRAGAVKMLQSAAKNAQAEHIASLGLNADKLQELLAERLLSIGQNDHVYEDIDLPIADSELEAWCIQACGERGLTWRGPSAMADDFLVQKHKLRDRSEVISERERQKQIRKEKGEAK